MAKRKIVEKSFDELDQELNTNYEAAASKLPADIAQGRKVVTDYMEIPIEQLHPFSGKKGEDFHRMSDQEFAALVETVRNYGVLEALLVRQIEVGYYEILSGEHRWRAAKEAGLTRVNCRIYRDIDDKTGVIIWGISNLMRREMSFSDRTLGWYHFWEESKQQGTRSDIDNTLKQNREELKLSIRQIQRYAHMYYLIPTMKQAVDDGKLNQRSAYHLSFLTEEQQTEVVPFLHLMTEEKAMRLKEISQEGQWEDIELSDIMMGIKRTPRPFTVSMTNIRNYIKTNVQKEYLPSVDRIVQEAMDMYFEKHPEVMRKTIH